MRRRQQQQTEEYDNYREELEVSFNSSEFSQSNHSGASSEAPSFLTSSLLAQHTEQMGKPGPVTKNERVAARRAVQQERTENRPNEARGVRRNRSTAFLRPCSLPIGH